MTAAPRLNTALAGRYAIEREAGAGGMATVYLARDLRHDRRVAVKVLHPDLAAALGAERFLAEIRTTANLQHPHILPLHDSGEADGFLFYVMPFVEGETLRRRLERERQLPLEDALRIGREVLSALDYAHRHGVVHRDVKPENVLLHDGSALVADFGIALAVTAAGGQRMTQTGLSLGTPQYMSPEQATGDRVIDGRTDVYSLGAVLYEMLAGEPPHAGNTAQAVIAKLMTETPRPVTVLRPAVPAQVDAALRRALEKLPADRFATARDMADALQGRGEAWTTTGVAARTAARPSARRRVLPWLAAGALGVVAGGSAVYAWHTSHHVDPEAPRFTVEPPAGMAMSDGTASEAFALSGDGRTVAFTAGPRRALYVRRLDRLDPAPVADVADPLHFELSEDGSRLAYRARSAGVFTTRVAGTGAGGAPTLLVDSVRGVNLAWKHGSDVVFGDATVFWRVPAAGGPPQRIAAADTGSLWTVPSILADARTIAFRVTPRGRMSGTAADRLGIVSLGGGAPAFVDLPVQNVLGYVDGFLVYGTHHGQVVGVRFDLASRAVRGEPVALLDSVVTAPMSGVAAALGANGTLAYLTGVSMTRVDVVDQRGARLATLPGEPRKYGAVRWSPDGRRLLLQSAPFGASDLWVYDTTSRVTTRLTRLGVVQLPRWMPDGSRVIFMGTGGNVNMSVPADGSAAPETVAASRSFGAVVGVSSDGRYLLAHPRLVRGALPDSMFAVPFGGGPPIPMLVGVTRPNGPVTSPDGRWIAYASQEGGGRREVYLRPFPTGAGRVQISSSGGDDPAWSRDGRRLFYRAPDAVRVATLDAGGALPRLARTDSLFPIGDEDELSVHPDGTRFAVLRAGGSGVRLVIATRWLDEALVKLRAK